MAAALRIFREMPNHGCPPDSDTYVTLINGLCELGKIGEAKELFNEMETKGCLPSVVMYTSLIHGFCHTINLDEAVGLFEHMKTKCLYLQLFDGWTLQGWAFFTSYGTIRLNGQ